MSNHCVAAYALLRFDESKSSVSGHTVHFGRGHVGPQDQRLLRASKTLRTSQWEPNHDLRPSSSSTTGPSVTVALPGHCGERNPATALNSRCGLLTLPVALGALCAS
jgi:hypothetical protein